MWLVPQPSLPINVEAAHPQNPLPFLLKAEVLNANHFHFGLFWLTRGCSPPLPPIVHRCSGIAELEWWPVPTSTLWVVTLPACPTLSQGRTCTSPAMGPKFSPWHPASSAWRLCPSRWPPTTRSKGQWTSTTPRSKCLLTWLFLYFLVSGHAGCDRVFSRWSVFFKDGSLYNPTPSFVFSSCSVIVMDFWLG